MSDTSGKRSEKLTALLDERDRAYIEAMPDPVQQESALCAVTTYRRPDRLKVGDSVPSLTLSDLGNQARVNLAAERDRPLVLLFGSYT